MDSKYIMRRQRQPVIWPSNFGKHCQSANKFLVVSYKKFEPFPPEIFSWLRPLLCPERDLKPFETPALAIVVAGTLLAITRQLLDLERCSNPLRIQQVF